MPVFVGQKDKVEDSGKKILARLTASLRSDGDFPVRAKVVTELRTLANNPNTTIDQISDIILREPSLGTRVLHLVNSAFYSRPQPIMTVTQAVVQLGMKALSDLCAGLVLMQKFVPAAQRGGIFADAVKKTIATSLLSNRLASSIKEEGVAEKGYLAGTFYNLAYLLLAFYFPQVYEAAAKRAHARNQDIVRSLTELLGISSAELALSIVDALRIPPFYRDVIELSYRDFASRRGDRETVLLSNCVTAAGAIAAALVDGKGQRQVEDTLEELGKLAGFSRQTLVSVVSALPELFRQHCSLIELTFLTLPEYLENFDQTAFQQKPQDSERPQAKDESGFSYYLSELKTAIENGEPVSSITALAMEALKLGLKYDRVVLLYADSERTHLIGRMGVGGPLPCDVREIRRKLDNRTSDDLDVKAFYTGTVQIFGEPVFEDGWPFAAFPLGTGERSRGVVYADRVSDSGAKPLDAPEQAALSVLMELLDQAVATEK